MNPLIRYVSTCYMGKIYRTDCIMGSPGASPPQVHLYKGSYSTSENGATHIEESASKPKN